MNKYGLFTVFKVKPGKRAELAEILQQASELIAKAKGIHQYLIYNDNKDENKICISEIWDTKEDHDNSLKIEGCMELIFQAFLLINGKAENIELEVLGGKGVRELAGVEKVY